MMMSSIDSTIVNVALVTLSREFDVTTDAIDAVVIAYIVALATFIPAAGWLGDRFGTKRVFLFALTIFTVASALCGLSGSFGQLVVFRALQGAGAGMLTPTGVAMLYRTFPPAERVRVSRILMYVMILGPAAGPVVGGLIIEQFSWPWAFYVNIPVGLFAFAFGAAFLHEHREPTAGGFDVTGFLLAGSGFALGMYAVSAGPTRGWSDPTIVTAGVLGVALLVAFAIVELRVPEPMVQLRLLSNRLFRTVNLVSLFASSAFLGVLFLVPLYLQDGRGASPLSSGLTTFPEALGVVISTQLVARIYPRVGPRRLMASVLLGVALAVASFSLISLDTSPWIVRGQMFLVGVGMAYVFLPAQAAGFATISSADTGRAATLSIVQRQLGGALGVALLSSVLAAFGASQLGASGVAEANLTAYRVAFLVSASLAAIAALIALGIPDHDAANTMLPRPAGDTGHEARSKSLSSEIA